MNIYIWHLFSSNIAFLDRRTLQKLFSFLFPMTQLVVQLFKRSVHSVLSVLSLLSYCLSSLQGFHHEPGRFGWLQQSERHRFGQWNCQVRSHTQSGRRHPSGQLPGYFDLLTTQWTIGGFPQFSVRFFIQETDFPMTHLSFSDTSPSRRSVRQFSNDRTLFPQTQTVRCHTHPCLSRQTFRILNAPVAAVSMDSIWETQHQRR